MDSGAKARRLRRKKGVKSKAPLRTKLLIKVEVTSVFFLIVLLVFFETQMWLSLLFEEGRGLLCVVGGI